MKVYQHYCCKMNAGVIVSDKFTREAVLVVNFLYL